MSQWQWLRSSFDEAVLLGAEQQSDGLEASRRRISRAPYSSLRSGCCSSRWPSAVVPTTSVAVGHRVRDAPELLGGPRAARPHPPPNAPRGRPPRRDSPPAGARSRNCSWRAPRRRYSAGCAGRPAPPAGGRVVRASRWTRLEPYPTATPPSSGRAPPAVAGPWIPAASPAARPPGSAARRRWGLAVSRYKIPVTTCPCRSASSSTRRAFILSVGS